MKNTSIRLILLFITIATVAPFYSAHAQDQNGFKPSGKVFVQFFGDYYYKFSGTGDASFSHAQYAKTPKNFNAFDIRRVYFGYTYNFAPKITAKVELAHEGDLLPDGNRGFYLKDAEVDIKDIIPYGNLIVGHTGTPTFATFTEHIWGYRSVEKTLLDMRKFGGSNDLGVALTGNFSKDKIFGYTVMIGNGTGAKPENSKYKKIYLELHAKLHNGLILEAYTDYEGGSNSNGTNLATTTFKGFIGYQIPTFTVGLSAVAQTKKNAVTNNAGNLVDAKPSGLSIFTHGQLVKNKLNGFARMDLYNPDKSYSYQNVYDQYYNESFVLFGLDYTPVKNVHFMPNIWINGYSAKNGAPSQKADVVGRVTFYYSF